MIKINVRTKKLSSIIGQSKKISLKFLKIMKDPNYLFVEISLDLCV